MKRAADLVEAVYAMPRNNSLNQLSLQQNGSVSGVSMGAFNSYTSQLGVSVPGDSTNSQGWPESSGGESQEISLYVSCHSSPFKRLLLLFSGFYF